MPGSERQRRPLRPPAARRRPGGASARRCRCLGRARPDDGIGRARGRRAALLQEARGQYLGHPQRPRGVRGRAPGDHRARAGGLRGRPPLGAGEPRGAGRAPGQEARIPIEVAKKQLEERTELTHNRIGDEQRASILEAGLALQKAGVVEASVDGLRARHGGGHAGRRHRRLFGSRPTAARSDAAGAARRALDRLGAACSSSGSASSRSRRWR
jgi:hypothetical protein